MSWTRRLALVVAAVCLGGIAVPSAPVAATQAGAHPAPGPAYRLLELPSGRVIAEARPDILATPVAPGSLMKLATLIAAVEDGLVNERTRLMCPRTVIVDGTSLVCVHPDLHRALSPGEALGYSCNAFFATVARKLRRPSLDAVLVRLGLQPLAASVPLASGALGLGGVRVTPPQLLEAFLRAVGASRHEVSMSDAARRILREGTEMAARSGTARALAAAGFSGLAKTGTAPMPGGGYSGVVTAVVNTELPTHAIVVFAPGAAGADAASLAAKLFVRHAVPRNVERVRIGVARADGGYDVRAMAVEDYVSRVVAGEMGSDAVPSALEAMAITARTFLEANRGRHEGEGFDLCDLTHCQVLGKPVAATDNAARSTAGLVLVDRGRAAQVYYSSWCGGHTETPSHAWRGGRDEPYLPAQADGACAGDAPWTIEVTERDLRRVLEAAGLRGHEVTRLSVASRYPSGRASLLAVAGMAPDRLDAGAFRSAAGRLLGWQTVKSTLFEIRRSATGYVLTGRGLGHGVGLCVRGAVNRGREGASRGEILSAYFPGLAVSTRPLNAGPSSAASVAADRVRVTLPERERAELGPTRSLAAQALRAVAERLGLPAPARVELVFHPTVEAYARATGQPWWTSARTNGSRIDLLPRSTLVARGILESTLRHEYTHVIADATLAGRPLWVREGLAVVVAGELAGEQGAQPLPDSAGGAACPSDDALRSPVSAEAWRQAYRDAGLCVSRALSSGRPWQELGSGPRIQHLPRNWGQVQKHNLFPP